MNNTLIVKQQLKNGTVKTWKLRNSQQVYTFGASRVADVISISPTSKGMLGTFECRDGKWWYIDMNMDTVGATNECQICIDSEKTLEIANSTVHLTPVIREADLYNRLEKNSHENDGHKKPYQLFLVKLHDKVIETRVVPMGQSFIPEMAVTKKVIPAKDSSSWVQYTLDQYLVRQKTVYLTAEEAMTRMTPATLIDKDARKGLMIVLLVGFMVGGLSLLGPKKEEIAVMLPPPPAQKIVVKTNPLKKKTKVAEAKPVQQPPSAPKEQKAASAPAGAGKIANMLKAVSDPRISRLIGKVSAQAAKSGNVIVSNGVKAGSGVSGRALAAVGNMDRSGRDYGTDSTAQGVMISTAGRGGGKNTSGIGGLGAGNTGNGGVGLIEEESEIVGGLDREVIAQYIKSQLGQILYCYERQLSANPDLFGKVAVKFTIAGTGSVETQAIGDTTLKNATVEGCILNKVAKWKFPAPAGGTKVLVTYPFLFKSTN
ncbi:AgmX/PglI C-terminal domain-containing protein [Bdellovibrio sp. HCB337]|uniref:AgmX/PglI C-terminal domain-containing protein n=1 Tax=Bdellovibrio sp. HCB337 TaxID=3394358 RepID=UPI0039A71238